MISSSNTSVLVIDFLALSEYYAITTLPKSQVSSFKYLQAQETL